jgi:cytochrome c-type biogenesis protein/peptide methionine sulfoxide reductase msrA/msrB
VWLGGIAIVALISYGIWSAIAPTPAPAQRDDPVFIEPAPDIRFSDINGTAYALSDFYERPTILTFIALWCSSCEYEVAELELFQHQHLGEFNYLLVDVDPAQDTRAQLRQFAAAHASDDFYFVFDETNSLTSAFGVEALQTTIVIDTDGNIIYRDSVMSELADLEKALADF